MKQILFIEFFSILSLIYGIRSRKKYKKMLDDKYEDKQRYGYDTLMHINGIILAGIAGVIGGIIFLITGNY